MKQTTTTDKKFECSRDGFFEYLKTCKGYDANNPNLWQEVADKIAKTGQFYKHGEEYACTEDLPLLKKHNERRADERHKFVLDVAPNPFEGDVFNAKIIILSGNPFFSDERNRTLYSTLNNDEQKRITEYSIKNLELDGEMLLDDEVVNQMRKYWKKKTKDLQWIWGFMSSDIAVIQYAGYPSLEMRNTAQVKQLKSVEFTKNLVEFLAKYRTDDYCFVIGRKKKIWQPLLQSFFNEQYDKYVVELNSSSNQTISKKNVTNWEKIESLIRQANKQRENEVEQEINKIAEQEIKKIKEAIAKDDGSKVGAYEEILRLLGA